MNQKKAQNAMEFMIVLIFLLTITSGIMYLTGAYLTYAKEKEQQQKAQNFADNINKELEILAKTEKGYKRELELTTSDYNVTINQSYLIMNDNLNNQTYYFSLLGNYTIDIETRINEFGQNTTILIFEK